MEKSLLKTQERGQLDPSFGDNGVVLLHKPSANDKELSPRSVSVDASGRSYVAGRLRTAADNFEYFCIRLTSDGTLDRSFGQGGYVTGRFDNDSSTASVSAATEVLLTHDNKILLSGYLIDRLNSPRAMVRLNQDGSLDEAFGSGGKVVIPLEDQWSARTEQSAATINAAKGQAGATNILLPDGSILLHSLVTKAWENSHSVVIRLTPEGALDTRFNATGYCRVAHPDFSFTQLSSVLLDAEGNYVFAGICYEHMNASAHALFTKLKPTGQLDTSFADNGFLVLRNQQPELSTLIDSLVVQTNKRLLAVGYTQGAEHCGVLISRENNGDANIQFNAGQPLMTTLDRRFVGWHNAAIQSDGSILVAGRIFDGTTQAHKVVARFTDAGVLDLSFGAGTGWLEFAIRPEQVWSSEVFVDGKLLFLATVNGLPQPCIARALLG